MVPGLERVAVGPAGAGQAAVRPGLLQRRVGLGCEPESSRVMHACLISVTSPEGNLTKAVERVGLQNPIADLARHGQGLLKVPGSWLVAAEPHVNFAEADQKFGLAGGMTHVMEQGQRVLEVSSRVLVAAQP